MSGQNIYDNDAFFENFRNSRSKEVNFNDCIETPILFSMLPDLRGKKILDIGCGMGQRNRFSESIFLKKCWNTPERITARKISFISGWPWRIQIRSAISSIW